MRLGRTIRTQYLTSLLLVLLIPLILLGVLSPLFYARTVEDLTVASSFEMIGQVNQSLDLLFLKWDQLMGLTARVPAVSAFLAGGPDGAGEVGAYLGALKATYPELTGIAVLDGQGRSRVIDFTQVNRDPLLEETWARVALGQPAAMHILARPIGRNLLSRRTMGDNVVAMSRAFPPGVLLFDLHVKTIEKVFATVKPGNQGFLFLVDPEGQVVYSPVNRLVYRIPASFLRGGPSRSLFAIDDKVYQVLRAPSAYTGLSTVAVYGQEEALAGVRLLGWVAAFSLLATLVLAVGVSFGVSRGIARPIVKLRRLMEEAEAGRLGVRYPDPPDDEVGRLGQSFNAMITEIGHLLAQVYEEQKLKREAEFRILQAQIKPHFLYNTLDTIHWMAQEKGAHDIVGIVEALTRLFRISLSRGQDVIRLEEELQHVTSYLVIQKIRYDEKFDYEVVVEPGLEDCPVVKLTLQPLVENALYHGIKENPGKGLLRVSARREGDALVLEVTDDGRGMDETTLERVKSGAADGRDPSASGFGVFSVHQRLRMVFGEAWGLTIASQPGKGTTVTVRQPGRLPGGEP